MKITDRTRARMAKKDLAYHVTKGFGVSLSSIAFAENVKKTSALKTNSQKMPILERLEAIQDQLDLLRIFAEHREEIQQEAARQDYVRQHGTRFQQID
jgi:hypothetical protein